MSNVGIAGRYEEGGDYVKIFNASTFTIEKYMVVCAGASVPTTTTNEINPLTGETMIQVMPNTVVAESNRAVGIAQQVIPPGTAGTALIFGRSFVRVAGQTLNANGRAHVSGAITGTVIVSTADPCVFLALSAASTGFNSGAIVETFTVSHALGFANFRRNGF